MIAWIVAIKFTWKRKAIWIELNQQTAVQTKKKHHYSDQEEIPHGSIVMSKNVIQLGNYSQIETGKHPITSQQQP